MSSTETVAIPEGRQQLLDALAALWRTIRRLHDEVPDVSITWGTSGRRGRTAGVSHLHGGTWSGELTIVDELAGEWFELFAAVLHEAVHALAAARGISVTSNNGRYHNTRFKPLADELGLTTTESEHWGWSQTQPTPKTVKVYDAELAALRVASSRYVVPEAPPAPSGRGRNNVVAVCGCTGSAARPFRIAPSKLALGPITCGVCGEQYRERPDTGG
ncbi:hypothetical protein [Amycolatopsis sp. NBC_01480]|uniref:hypothetical protein n=1 Tax=Amycolatopsis sp. NBC_01480 TaxID=2903562 RepID=UPI002E288746|nr:hypothetical protein [Amycolatopsis sp. NBC_01480]